MTIEELEQKLNECQKALAELKESKKEKWKPQIGEKYWFRSTDNFIGWLIYNFQGDDWRINNIPIFKTQDECERYWRFIDTVKEKSYEFSVDDFANTSIEKWYIGLKLKGLYVDFIYGVNQLGSIYFKTAEDAQYIIDNFKEELMEFWL